MQVNNFLPVNFNPSVSKGSAKFSQAKSSKIEFLAKPSDDTSKNHARVFELNPDVDFIAAGEEPNFKQQSFTAQAKKALQGYWQVAHSSFSGPRYVDVYV